MTRSERLHRTQRREIRGALHALASVALAAVLGSNADAQLPDEEQLHAWAEEFAGRDLTLDVDALQLEVLNLAECIDDFDVQQDQLFRKEHFPTMWRLYRALGHDIGRDPAHFRRRVCEGLARSFLAYFSPSRQTMVCIDGTLQNAFRDEHSWVHELAHAWRDQQTELREILASGERSFERTRILQCLIEGEAEAVAIDLMLRRQGQDLSALDVESLDDAATRMRVGEAVTLVYTYGRRYVVQQIQDRGFGALRRLYERAPTSSEQILHPEKLGKDGPSKLPALELPPELGEVAEPYSDTIGQLGTLGILLDIGMPRDEVWQACVGWDGDRLDAVTMEGSRWLVWRWVFDREVDAQQFAALWEPVAKGVVGAQGRLVAWAWNENGENGASLLAAALSTPVPINEPDAASTTAALEDARFGEHRHPRVENGRWIVPEFGVSVPVPEGWEAVDHQGSPILFGTDGGGFRDNILPMRLPDPGATDADAIFESTREEFSNSPGLHVHTCDIRPVGGIQCVYVTYGAVVQGFVLEFRALVVPRGDHRLVLTGTVLNQRAQEVVPIVDRALLAAEFLEH